MQQCMIKYRVYFMRFTVESNYTCEDYEYTGVCVFDVKIKFNNNSLIVPLLLAMQFNIIVVVIIIFKAGVIYWLLPHCT